VPEPLLSELLSSQDIIPYEFIVLIRFRALFYSISIFFKFKKAKKMFKHKGFKHKWHKPKFGKWKHKGWSSGSSSSEEE
jgi:hypothetical protein